MCAKRREAPGSQSVECCGSVMMFDAMSCLVGDGESKRGSGQLNIPVDGATAPVSAATNEVASSNGRRSNDQLRDEKGGMASSAYWLFNCHHSVAMTKALLASLQLCWVCTATGRRKAAATVSSAMNSMPMSNRTREWKHRVVSMLALQLPSLRCYDGGVAAASWYLCSLP